MERRQKEFLIVQENAFKKLRALNSDCKPLLRIWEFQSFGDYFTWHIFKEENDRYTCIEKIWHRAKDCSRFINPLIGLKNGFHQQPSISEKRKNIQTHSINRLLENLKVLQKTGFTINQNIVLDGTILGIECYETGLSFEWNTSSKEHMGISNILTNLIEKKLKNP